MSVAESINRTAVLKKVTAAKAAAEQKAKADAPPLEVVNIRNVRRNAITREPGGSLMFPATTEHSGFELTPGDNLIDVAKLTPTVQDQLADWVNAGWIQVLPAERPVTS